MRKDVNIEDDDIKARIENELRKDVMLYLAFAKDFDSLIICLYSIYPNQLFPHFYPFQYFNLS